ncbi:MAG: T9SS type A sorting domain-containing protein [Paludibacter sp.]|nr:T9SS type A sorting domain-containing protein [Paludibacter sp.]
MKKLFMSLCLFLAISTVFAQTFVPDPNKIYNIVESTSNNVVGASGTQPALTVTANLASQAFRFVPTGSLDTYYVLSVNHKYFNKKNSDGYSTIFESAISGTNSEWVIVGADATSIRLINNNNSKYLASDATSVGSSLYCDKAVDNTNGLYKLQEATFDATLPIEVYNENFNTSWATNWGNDSWIGSPSTVESGKWSGGVNLQTVGDGIMDLEQWWGSNGHILVMTTTSAAVIIPDINVAGYDNLRFSIDARRNDGAINPIVDVKVGTGDWVSVATLPSGQYWNWLNSQVVPLNDANGIQLSNLNTISLRISAPLSGGDLYLDNVKVIGLIHSNGVATSLSGASKDVFSVYPNPATNYILAKNAQKVTISDLNGRIVKEAFNAEKVDVSSLAKGAYIVKAQVNNTTKIGKLIKE